MGKIDDLIADYNKGGDLAPGMSVAIIQDGKCIYKMSNGYANLEHQIKIDSKTTFYLASLSKSFTAAGIMLLHERGKLDITDKIHKYFSNLPNYCMDIRIMNLVNHTSGLKDYFDSYFENNKNLNGITNQDVYNFILNDNSLSFPTGEKFQYTNTGYVLLSLLIEKASNQTYAEFINENFLLPLRMKNTYVFTEDKPIIPNKAYGYKESNGQYLCDDYYVLTTGDGGIYSCIDDLILWVETFNNEKIFSKKTMEKIFSKGILNNGSACFYGFGWFLSEKKDKEVAHHSGQLAGFTNLMVKFPDNNLSIIILTNYLRDSFQKIIKSVNHFSIEGNREYWIDSVI